MRIIVAEGSLLTAWCPHQVQQPMTAWQMAAEALAARPLGWGQPLSSEPICSAKLALS